MAELQKRDFPLCCSAKILADFGQDTNTAGDNFNGYKVKCFTNKELIEQLKENINSYKRSGYATLVATTTSAQKQANKCLREVGFKSSKWMKKGKHKETKLRVWWYPLEG